MDLCSVSFVVFVGVVTCWFLWVRPYRRQQKLLPPGPYPFPVIGNIHQLGRNPNQTLAKLSKTYGPLMSLHLGRLYTVVASSPEMAREIMQKHDQAFSSRTILAAVEAHKMSVAFLPVGNQWRKFRKVTNEHMFTTSRLEASQGLRQEKLQKLVDFLKTCSESGLAVNIGEAVFTTTLNLMSSTLFSTEVATFGSDSSHKFRKTFESLVESIGKPNLGDYFPVLKPFDLQGIKREANFCLGEFHALMRDLINQRLESKSGGTPHKHKTDLLETLLHDLPHYDLSIEDITCLVMDLFMGGQDAIFNTVEWAMTELLLNPETLAMAKQELRSVLGEKSNKQAEESDISRLPYLRAVVKETFRLHPPGPFLIPRKSEKDVQVRGGYVIPKGTQVLINVWAIGRDPTVWGPNWESFGPERFLVQDKDNIIDLKGQHFELTPFGSGRRMCAGFTLAYRMLHMTLATLIHNFDWKLEVSSAEIEEDHRREVFGIAVRKAVPLKAIPIAL